MKNHSKPIQNPNFSLVKGQYFSFFKGRVALYAILKAIGIGREDEVVLPGFTCVVVPSAIVFCGAKPVYVDIENASYNIDPKLIEKAINSRTKALIVQHTFGIPAEMEPIRAIAASHGIPIIEDCAHCFGSLYKGDFLGSLGDAAFFSTQWSKPITTGLGGLAVINDPKLEDKIKTILPSFQFPSLRSRILLRFQYLAYKTLFSPKRYWILMNTYRRMANLGFAIGSSEKSELNIKKPANYQMRMGAYQEHLISNFLENRTNIQKMINHRRTVTQIYKRELQQDGITLPSIPKLADVVFLRYPVRVRNKKEFLAKAKLEKMEIGSWFDSPLHPNVKNLELLSYRWGQCPNAEQVCREVINLPTHSGIGEKEALRTVEFLRRYGEVA